MSRSTSAISDATSRISALAEAARGDGGAAEPDAAGVERRIDVERNGVLVDGDAGAVERLFGLLAAHAFGEHVHQHQVGIGAAGDDAEAFGLQARRPAPARWR